MTDSTVSANLASGGFGGTGGRSTSFPFTDGGNGGMGGAAEGSGIHGNETMNLTRVLFLNNIATGGRGGVGGPGTRSGIPGDGGGSLGGGLWTRGETVLTDVVISNNAPAEDWRRMANVVPGVVSAVERKGAGFATAGI